MTVPAWHALLAPLPPECLVTVRPVLSAEVEATLPKGDAGADAADSVRGWTQRVAYLNAVPAGLRVVTVVLDAAGARLSMSDMVLWGSGDDGAATSTESIGGRFTADGVFQGTYWLDRSSAEPTAKQVAGVHALVADLLSREAKGEG